MRKILVIQTASIGDVILATALLEKLHLFYPEARIDFLVKKGMEGLFDGHPFIHRLLLWDKSKKYRDFLRILKTLRKEKYDVAVNIQRFAMTGLLTILSGAKQTIGFSKNPLSRFFSKAVPHEIRPGIHETDRNQTLIAEMTDAVAEKPRLYPPPPGPLPNKEGKHRQSTIDNRQPTIYYTISPASLWFTKQYPAERWVELIREMPPEASVYLLGSQADRELCEEIMNKGRWTRDEGRHAENLESGIINLAGQLSLLESAALMKEAKMNFTNDSAPMHLASAVNAPVTVVYCSTTPDFGFGPLSDDKADIQVSEPLACRPCGLHGKVQCQEKHFNCAYKIELSQLVFRI